MEYCLGSASDLLEGELYEVFRFASSDAPSEHSGRLFAQNGVLQMVEAVCLYCSIL